MKSASFSIAILNFFSRHGQYFHPTKDQPRTRPTSIFFCTFAVILDKFSAPTSSIFFLWKIWVITNTKSAANIIWWVYWMRNRGLPLPIFCTFFYPSVPLNQLCTDDEEEKEKLMQRMLSCCYWCLGRKSWRLCLGWPLTSYCSLLQPNLFQ